MDLWIKDFRNLTLRAVEAVQSHSGFQVVSWHSGGLTFSGAEECFQPRASSSVSAAQAPARMVEDG